MLDYNKTLKIRDLMKPEHMIYLCSDILRVFLILKTVKSLSFKTKFQHYQ